VPANTTIPLTPVGGLQQTVTSLATQFNDVATATYTDAVTNQPIPDNPTAQAAATVTTGTIRDSSVDVTDSESITGTALKFAVATPSVGSFTGGYVHDTYTIGPVGWDSGTQTDTSSVTFNKTIKLDPAQSTSGHLDDTATLTGLNGFTKSDGLKVDISSSKKVTLTIDKTIPAVLQTGDPSQTFTFDVYNSGNTIVATKTLTFNPGDTHKSVDIPDLPGDTYTVKETASAAWAPQDNQVVDLNSACSGTASFANKPAPALAQAVKVTD